MMPHLHGKFQVDILLMDQLEEEFLVYQGMSNNEISLKAAVYEKETTVYHQMDII